MWPKSHILFKVISYPYTRPFSQLFKLGLRLADRSQLCLHQTRSKSFTQKKTKSGATRWMHCRKANRHRWVRVKKVKFPVKAACVPGLSCGLTNDCVGFTGVSTPRTHSNCRHLSRWNSSPLLRRRNGRILAGCVYLCCSCPPAAAEAGLLWALCSVLVALLCRRSPCCLTGFLLKWIKR